MSQQFLPLDVWNQIPTDIQHLVAAAFEHQEQQIQELTQTVASLCRLMPRRVTTYDALGRVISTWYDDSATNNEPISEPLPKSDDQSNTTEPDVPHITPKPKPPLSDTPDDC
jgi:hypothetical protein